MKQRRLVEFAREMVGITEQGGENRGQMVERFQKEQDGKASGEPWCAAFVFYCINVVDRMADVPPFGKTRLHKSELVTAVWGRSPEDLRGTVPEPGSLVVWRRYDASGRPTWAGHIGIVTQVLPDGTLMTIEGNTSADGGDPREGDGVFEKHRDPFRGMGNLRVEGYLYPWGRTY